MWVASVAECLFGGDRPLAPFDAHDGCSRALLLARAGLLATAWWVATKRTAPGPDRWFVAVSIALLASLVARCLFLPFAVLATYAGLRERRALIANVVALGLAVVVAAWPRALPASDDLTWEVANPAAETSRWAARDNAFRARFWAAKWSAREVGLGKGHLMLARADWAAGHVDEARQLAAKIAAEAENEQVRAQASEVLHEWEQPSP